MKILSQNKSAFNYQILEKFEAGMALTGQEVKSIRLGRLNLTGSFVVIKNEEVYLIGAKIPAYQPKNAPLDYNEERSRKLLLKRMEIKSLIGRSGQKGLTLLPLKVYSNYAKIKLEFGLAKKKKKFDRREDIKKREQEREISREFGRV